MDTIRFEVSESETNDDTPLAEIFSDVFARPLNGSQALVNFKCMLMQRALFEQQEKAGIVRTQSGAGRAAQGLASAVIPGNMSTVRKPIRSQIYSAISPGGNNRGGLPGSRIGGGSVSRNLRCPAGFEFGGRFASRGLGNCGRQLFDLPGGGIGGIGSGRNAGGGAVSLVGLLRREGRALGSPNYGGRAVQIERAAQIPRVAAANDTKFAEGIGQAVSALSSPNVNGAVMVRRDGQALRPTVGVATLANITKNPDMQDAALVLSADSPKNLGDQEISTLWRSGIRQVSYAIPGGGSISLRRARNLNTGEKRRLARAWAKSSTSGDEEFDYGARLRAFADNSNGLVTYEEKFPNVDKPNDMVTIAQQGNGKRTATVRSWVQQSYLAANAPGRDKNQKPWDQIESSTQAEQVKPLEIDSAEAASKFLKGNGSPEQVPAEYLDAALRRSKVFRATRVGPNSTLLERGDGKKWYRKTEDGSYTHLAEKISADVNSALGLEAPPVKFIGKGDNRDVLVAHPSNLGSGNAKSRRMKDVNNEDLLRTIVADWLVDHRDRNTNSLLSTGSGEKQRLIASGNSTSALAGLSADALAARRKLVLGDFLQETRNEQAREKYQLVAAQQRKLLIELYDNLLKKAEKFNWDDYVSRLGLDGGLSAGEKAHIRLVRSLFENRLEQLRKSRQKFFVVVGIA